MTTIYRRFLAALTVACIAGTVGTVSPVFAKGLGFGFEPGLEAGEDYVAGELIVGFHEVYAANAAKSLALAATRLKGQVVNQIPGQAALVRFATDQEVPAAAQALLALPGVAFVERNAIITLPPEPALPIAKAGAAPAAAADVGTLAVSADRGVGYQWHHTVIGKTRSLPALSATPPTVAVIDTGVDYTHPELAGKVFLGRNVIANTMDPMDDAGHGTHVAGIIAAIAGNGFYGEGVCHNCKILAVKVLGQSGSGTSFGVATGMAYVVSVRNATTPPVKVVNMSLGSSVSSATIAAQVLAMKNAGLALAAAAGNDNNGDTATLVVSYPGADPNTALRVMSTEENDTRSWFSNFSLTTAATRYNIAAPGTNILSTLPAEGFGPLSGTSMATPVVAGVAAVVWGQLPALTRDQLVARLVNTGKLVSKGFAVAARRVNLRNAISGVATTDVGAVGRLVDPFNALPHSPVTTPSTAALRLGLTTLGTDATNRGGWYEFVGLAGASRTLWASRPAVAGSPAFPLSALRSPITIPTGGVAGPSTDAMPRARAAGNASITVDWSTTQPAVDTTGCLDACQGWEFDLFVRTPSGALIYWGAPGDLLAAPFVYWPRDSADDLQPLETTIIGSTAANGVYKVVLDKWPSTTGEFFAPSWAGSGAQAQIYNGAAVMATLTVPACGTTRYWYVGDLTKTSATAYTWTPRNTCVAALP